MIVKTKELVGALKAAAMFASDDETRPHMNAVHVEAVGVDALCFVATDGHTLWCCEISAFESSADPAPAMQPAWNIPLSAVTSMVKALKELRDVEVEVEVDLVKHTVGTVPYGDAGEYFSPYQHVLPAVTTTTTGGKVIPEFATNYVARCCEALTHYGKGLAPELLAVGSKYDKKLAREQRDAWVTPPVAWAVAGEMCPALFYSPKFPCAFAIVMPRKGEGRSKPVIDGFVERVRRVERKTVAA